MPKIRCCGGARKPGLQRTSECGFKRAVFCADKTQRSLIILTRYARRIGRHVLSDYPFNNFRVFRPALLRYCCLNRNKRRLHLIHIAIITRIIRLKIGVITFSTEVLFMQPGCGAPPRYKECLKKYAFSDFCNAALRTYRRKYTSGLSMSSIAGRGGTIIYEHTQFLYRPSLWEGVPCALSNSPYFSIICAEVLPIIQSGSYTYSMEQSVDKTMIIRSGKNKHSVLTFITMSL